MASVTHHVIDWLFDKPLRSNILHRLARAYCRVYQHGIADRSDIRINGELQLLNRLAPEIVVAFDVGANVGEWSEELLKLRPNASIHAFEPVTSTREQFEQRGLPKSVILNPFGLSDRATSAQIHDYGGGGGLNSVYRRDDLEKKNASLRPKIEEIQLDTLDDYAANQGVNRIDFLKIDVEGHELSVLRGAQRMIAEQRIRMVQIEYGTSFHYANALLRDIYDVLAPAGMTGGRIVPGGVEKHERYETLLENFGMSNWVFAKADDDVVWG